MRITPNLDRMAIFAEVVEGGSFTSAARVLDMPKSTVSQRIAELEARLGTRLLQRTTRKLSLTAAGQVYLSHCKTMLNAAYAADAALAQLRGTPSGKLRVTAPEASGTRFFARLLPEFLQKNPEIDLEFIVTDAHLDLITERIDVALRTGRLEDSSFISRKIGPVKRVLAASPSYLANHSQIYSLEHLNYCSAIIHSPANTWPLIVNNEVKTIEPTNILLRCTSLTFVLEALLAGAGIAMLPAFMCAQELQRGELVQILPNYPIVPNEYYAVMPNKSYTSSALTAFLEFVFDGRMKSMLVGESI